MTKCAYSKCINYFYKYRNKKFCCYLHGQYQWVLDNHEKRLQQSMRYERKKGKIPRKEFLATQWKKENNPNWRGGHSFRTNKEEWRKLANEVRERDDNKCQLCKISKDKVSKMPVHHIIPYNVLPEDKKDNLITLCNSCHCKVEWRIRKGADFISALL